MLAIKLNGKRVTSEATMGEVKPNVTRGANENYTFPGL